MVWTENSWTDMKYLAWKLHNHNSMNASQEINKQESVPMFVNSGNYLLYNSKGVQGFAIPLAPSFKVEQKKKVDGSQCLFPYFKNSLGTPWTYEKAKDSLQMPVPKPNIDSHQKSFVIFDQSGNQKKLMNTSVCPSDYIPSTVAENYYHFGCIEEEWTAREINSVKYFSRPLSKENHVAGKGSEMHEDTEEIDALLYSDEDSIGCSSDDEVTSTGRSPELINECYEKEEQRQAIIIEAASSGGPRKRQRVHGVGYIKAPLIGTVSCVKFDELEKFSNDVESCYKDGQEKRDGMNYRFSNRSEKDNIKETLRVLESIVPGAKGKDPLLVIDEAIDYLTSLKHEATSLGVSCY